VTPCPFSLPFILSLSLRSLFPPFFLYIHHVHTQGAAEFFRCNIYNVNVFTQFSMHNFARECQSTGAIISCRFVATVPCKSFRHKSNTFRAILSLCTCLCQSNLRKPVSIKRTQHSIKSQVQNLCSKCPTFTRTHALRRLRHSAITAAMMEWSSNLHSLSRGSFNSFTSWIRER